MTFRQLLAWQEWRHEQWSKPSRSDHYIMQLNLTLINMFAKQKVEMEKLLIKFQRIVKRQYTAEELTELSKMKWGAIAGIDLTKEQEEPTTSSDPQ